MLANTLGNDNWASESRAKLRDGLRSRTNVDYGGLKVFRVYENIVLSDGAFCEFPISYKSEAEAVTEFQRITSGLDRGYTISEIIPGVELPVEIATAWIN
jgi:hypothetical protein